MLIRLNIAIIIMLFFSNTGAGELPAPVEIELWDENQTEDFIFDLESAINSINDMTSTILKLRDKSCFLFHFLPNSDNIENNDEFLILQHSLISKYSVDVSSYEAIFIDISERYSFYPKIRYIIINRGEIIYGESRLVSKIDKRLVFNSCKDVYSFRRIIESSDNSILNAYSKSISAENIDFLLNIEKLKVNDKLTDRLVEQIRRIDLIEHIPAKEEEIINFVDISHNIIPTRIGDNIVYIGIKNKITSILVPQYISNEYITGNMADALLQWFKETQEMIKSRNINNEIDIDLQIEVLFCKMIINGFFYK